LMWTIIIVFLFKSEF